jgi:hypothetical protein
MKNSSDDPSTCSNVRKRSLSAISTGKHLKKLITIFSILPLGLMSASESVASSYSVSCRQISNISHPQVHFGMSVAGRRVSASEINYLHNKYHYLSQACRYNPRARTLLKASPQLISLMSDYGLLN